MDKQSKIYKFKIHQISLIISSILQALKAKINNLISTVTVPKLFKVIATKIFIKLLNKMRNRKNPITNIDLPIMLIIYKKTQTIMYHLFYRNHKEVYHQMY